MSHKIRPDDYLPYALPVAFSLTEQKRALLYQRVSNYLIAQEQQNSDNTPGDIHPIEASLMSSGFHFSTQYLVRPQVHDERRLMSFPIEKKIR